MLWNYFSLPLQMQHSGGMLTSRNTPIAQAFRAFGPQGRVSELAADFCPSTAKRFLLEHSLTGNIVQILFINIALCSLTAFKQLPVSELVFWV